MAKYSNLKIEYSEKLALFFLKIAVFNSVFLNGKLPVYLRKIVACINYFLFENKQKILVQLNLIKRIINLSNKTFILKIKQNLNKIFDCSSLKRTDILYVEF